MVGDMMSGDPTKEPDISEDWLPGGVALEWLVDDSGEVRLLLAVFSMAYCLSYSSAVNLRS